MIATIEPFEHWCTDGGCGAQIIEHKDGIDRVLRYKLSIPEASWLFNTLEEATEFAVKYDYNV